MNTEQLERSAAIVDALAYHPPERVTDPDGVIITRAADLQIEPISWLWDGWLARGKLHLLAGTPGQGKTTIALALAAAVTAGGRWPDGTRCEPGNVLIYSGEDDPADTLAPRLLAAGADLSRVHFVTGTRTNGETLPFDPARDLDLLRGTIKQIGGLDLLVVDPIVGAVTGDSHKNTETRRGLQPLVDLAAACRCALIGITHFSKSGQGIDPAMRVIGSVAFTALARVVMVVAKIKGENGEPARILARAKSNIGPDDGGFEYHLDQVEVTNGIEAARVGWGKAVNGTARELLTDPDAPADDDQEDAEALLRAELATDCWTPADAASAPLRAAGFSKKQIWKAGKKLRIVRKQNGFQGTWYWRLPGGIGPALPVSDSPSDSIDSHFSKRESLESLGLEVESLDGCSPAVKEVL